MVMTLLAYLFVLGNATPVFLMAYLVLPGMKLFRFPTRFLIVVELGLALLAAFGLMRLRADLERSAEISARMARGVALAVCFAHGDGSLHPSAPAESDGSGHAWLTPPPRSKCHSCWQSEAAHIHASPPGSAPAIRSSVRTAGRTSNPILSCATSCSRTPAAASGKHRPPTVMPASRRDGM